MIKYIGTLLGMFLCGSLSFAQTLDDYYKIAAENNPGLQAVYKEYEATLQKVPQVNSLPDPTFSFGYLVSPVETRAGMQLAKFSLTQMFPWFGTLKAQGDAAATVAEAKFQGFMDARNQLYLKVASAFYPLYELNEWIEIEQENIDILETYKTVATKKIENGKGTMIDVLRVDIMLKDAQTNFNILRSKKKSLLTSFNKLLNRPENEMVVMNESLNMEKVMDNFRKDSLLNNPVLKALDLNAKASQLNALAAKKQGLPKIGVGMEYVIVGEQKDMLMPMVSMTIPIFRKKYNASIKEAQLMQESYALQKVEVENSLVSNYEMIWFDIQQQQQLLELYEQQIHSSQQSLNLLYTEYGNSGNEFEEVLRMQQQLLKYRKMRATAIMQFHIAMAEINYLSAKTY